MFGTLHVNVTSNNIQQHPSHPPIPWVEGAALLDADVRGREHSLGVLVTQREATVPASILLQDMHHIAKL